MYEATIDAMGLAAIERSRRDTLYAATAGGMGLETVAALRQLLQASDRTGKLIAARITSRTCERSSDLTSEGTE